MSLLSVLGLVLGGALFGSVAWRRVTATMRYRSFNSTIRPGHVAQEDYEDWALARRRRARLVKVAVAVAVGALVGWVLVTMLGAGLGRR